jgi:putative endonuclease
MWVVYIVECADRSLYTGMTNDLDQRMAAHRAGKGAKYTKHRGPLILRYTETLDSKGAALRREAAIKALDRSAKLLLIAAPPDKQAGKQVLPRG